jgi:hypothetical protein
MQRFELKSDSENTWSVVDSLSGLPIQAKGKPMVGLTLEEAEKAALQANTGILHVVSKPPTR